MPSFTLPYSSSLTSLDPLGICDDSESPVACGALLNKLLDQADHDLQASEIVDGPADVRDWTQRLQRLLEDLAYSLHGDHSLNTGGIGEANFDTFLELSRRRRFRECLFHSARQLMIEFPDGELLMLSQDHPTATLTAGAMDALLAHMVLGTFQIPVGNTWGRPGFTQYYDGKVIPVVRNTATPYLITIMAHFADGGYMGSIPEKNFTFSRFDAKNMPNPATSKLAAPQIPVTLVDPPKDPSAKLHTFVLVAANAQPGPGAGGTHEERLVGQSPALALASLLTPVLAEDEAVVTSELSVHAAWKGHGRTAEMTELYKTEHRSWRQYIIADALPLDLSHSQADLRPGNVNREVRKLYAAFRGAKHAWEATGEPLKSMKIELPPWGCGAFGGRLSAKVPCMMIAAGLAGLGSDNLELLVPADREQEMTGIPTSSSTVRELYANVSLDG